MSAPQGESIADAIFEQPPGAITFANVYALHSQGDTVIFTLGQARTPLGTAQEQAAKKEGARIQILGQFAIPTNVMQQLVIDLDKRGIRAR